MGATQSQSVASQPQQQQSRQWPQQQPQRVPTHQWAQHQQQAQQGPQHQQQQAQSQPWPQQQQWPQPQGYPFRYAGDNGQTVCAVPPVDVSQLQQDIDRLRQSLAGLERQFPLPPGAVISGQASALVATGPFVPGAPTAPPAPGAPTAPPAPGAPTAPPAPFAPGAPSEPTLGPIVRPPPGSDPGTTQAKRQSVSEGQGDVQLPPSLSLDEAAKQSAHIRGLKTFTHEQCTQNTIQSLKGQRWESGHCVPCAVDFEYRLGKGCIKTVSRSVATVSKETPQPGLQGAFAAKQPEVAAEAQRREAATKEKEKVAKEKAAKAKQEVEQRKSQEILRAAMAKLRPQVEGHGGGAAGNDFDLLTFYNRPPNRYSSVPF